MKNGQLIKSIIDANELGVEVKNLVNETLKLHYAESMTRKGIEDNVYNNFRVHMTRIKERTGFNVVYSRRNQLLTVTRLEDEEVR